MQSIPTKQLAPGWNYVTQQTYDKLTMLSQVCQKYNASPASMPYDVRLDLSLMFAAALHDFVEFAELGMRYLGFRLSPIQADIAAYMQHGPSKRMVQAQRSQAKSTLAALYSVWQLIRNPQTRSLVVSAGASQASDVARIQIRLIEQWVLLCWLRADPSAGDRVSFEAYDVHYQLRNVDKTASISCIGITANLQGRRADLLIPDDIESQKNSTTQAMRELLLTLTKEFSAICTNGEIMYLGTPQSKDSVYRSLPNRGFDIRVWPSRYPTPDEMQHYIPNSLAPIVLQAIQDNPALQTGGGLTGQRGQPIDPTFLHEELLQEKELDYGDEGYALQYQLDTSLSDAMRTKIKLSDLLVVQTGFDYAPEVLLWSAEPRWAVKKSSPALSLDTLYSPSSTSAEFCKYEHRVMFIDPAGTGGDEVAFCVGAVANGYIHMFSTGGLIGGMSTENIHKLLDIAVEFNVKLIRVEKNMGHGTVTALLLSEVRGRTLDIAVQDYYTTGQKERRIIDTIAPVVRRHKLVVHQRSIDDDWLYCCQHGQEKRMQFSLFRQLADITYDRGSLMHDDRADCLQAMVAYFVSFLSIDVQKATEQRRAEEVREFLQYPLGRDSSVAGLFPTKPRHTRGKIITY